jgi:long-chain fatty acid transport protein
MTAFSMLHPRRLAIAALCGFGSVAAAASAMAGGFSVREQSTTYLGTAFAGSAAGGDISGIFWNSAATGVAPGCNTSSNYALLLGSSDETARSGVLVTGTPIASGLSPTSTDVGSDAVVPASYLTCQLTDKLYAGLALNSQFGLLTKPDDLAWAGSPIAVTSKVFSANLNPTLAYRVTPALTLGVGLQLEYLKIRLNHGSFPSLAGPPLAGSRQYEADDWGVGATAGVLWQPMPGTALGLGFRSAVSLEVSGTFRRGASLTTPAAVADAEAGLTLPEQVTFSIRQALAPRWTLLGTVEWTNWSRLGDVAATGPGCGPSGVCEVLNLSYRDGWLFALGAEYAYSPLLTLRGGAAYEISPIEDRTRDILVPDSNRVWVSLGASYRYSESITVDLAYSHIFFDDAPFCIASQSGNGGSSHCNGGTPPAAILLRGDIDAAADILSVGLRYRF